MHAHVCAGRKDRFLHQHEAALRLHYGELPAPARAPKAPLPDSFSKLTVLHHSAEGVVSATAENSAAAYSFLSLFQEESGAEFSVTQRNHRKISRVERSCRYAGQPDGPDAARFRRQAEQRGPGVHSCRRVGCLAKVIFWEPTNKKDVVRVEVRLSHTGHALGCDQEVINLKLHPRWA